MSANCALIINPVSGKYSEGKLRQIMALLSAHGYAPELFVTRGAEDAGRFARQICELRHEPLIVAGGGDGTVNDVLNGLMPGKAALAVLPLGTANVLAAELGISSVDDAVQRIVRRETRPLAAGVVKGEGMERYFALMAGIGIDGEIVRNVRGNEKKALKQGAYLLSALRSLRSWDRSVLEVTADGARYSCHSVVACNAARYGGSFRLAPGANIFTPGFEVVCIVKADRGAFLRLALRTVFGRGGGNREVRRFTARSLEITGSKPVQVDGDFCCNSPVLIESVPAYVRLVV